MGTLFNQEPRRAFGVSADEVVHAIRWVKEIATDTGVSFDQALKVYEVSELARRNDLYHANGDIHDEQMMGLGVLLREFISTQSDLTRQISSVASAIYKLGDCVADLPADLDTYKG